MITTIFDFTTPSDYTLSNVEISGVDAVISRNTPSGSLSKNNTFSTPDNYIYDSSLIDLGAGNAKLKDLRAANNTFYAAWSSQLNGNYGTGSLTVTANGGAAISGGYLNMVGSGKYASLPTATGYQPVQIGTIAFEYIPGYTGHPAVDQLIYTSGLATNGIRDYLAIVHNASGSVQIQCLNDASATIFDVAINSNWSVTAGQVYKIVFQVDVTNGASKFFIDGVQQGATQTGTGSRAASGWNYLGNDRLAARTGQNFSIGGFAFYNAIVSPTGATPLSPTIYSVANPTIDCTGNAVTAGIPLNSIDSFLATISASGSDAVKFTISTDGGSSYLYWNGTMWTSSTGYSQSNTLAEIQANVNALNLTSGLFLIRIYLHSNDGSTAPSVDDVNMTYRELLYYMGGGTILTNSNFDAEEITNFDVSASFSGSDLVKYALVIDGVKKYWNGTSWATSNGSIAETNVLADIQANLSSLLGSINSEIQIYAVLVSADGTSTPSLTSMTVTYIYGAIENPPPATCIIYGFLRDIRSNPVAGATVTFTLGTTVKNGYMEAANHVLIASSVSTATDNEGYFEQAIIQSPQIEGSSTYIAVSIQKGTAIENLNAKGGLLTIEVPAAAAYDITDLLVAP